jgi:hypothetical protein
MTKPARPGWTMPPPPWPCCVAVAFMVEGEWDVGWMEDGKPVDHYLVLDDNRIGWPFGLFQGATAEDLRALGFQIVGPTPSPP